MVKTEVRRAQFPSLMSEVYQRKHARCSSYGYFSFFVRLVRLPRVVPEKS